MNKSPNTSHRRNFLLVKVLLLTILNSISSEAKEPRGTIWFNWVDYVCNYPDYRKHQEPQDIATQGCSWGTWVTFPNKIAAIAAKVKNWDDPTALFTSLDFVAIYKYPGHYYDHCLAYLADPQKPEKHKEIVIYALEQHGDTLAHDCYQLYQKRQLNEELLKLALGDFNLLHIHPLVRQKQHATFLKQVQSKIGVQTPIGVYIDSILSGQLIKKWGPKESSNLLHYRDKLSVTSTIQESTKEYLKYIEGRQWLGEWKSLSEEKLAILRGHQGFLMLLEHVNEHIFVNDEAHNNDFFSFLKSPQITNDEKRVFLLAMYRLDLPGVASLLNRIYWYYRTGKLPLTLLEDLFYSSIIPKSSLLRPFLMLYSGPYAYEEGSYFFEIPETLNQFIASPTITSDWKKIAKRFKKGTLLSKKEMKYLEGYQEFLATHFILYETIPPHK